MFFLSYANDFNTLYILPIAFKSDEFPGHGITGKFTDPKKFSQILLYGKVHYYARRYRDLQLVPVRVNMNAVHPPKRVFIAFAPLCCPTVCTTGCFAVFTT